MGYIETLRTTQYDLYLSSRPRLVYLRLLCRMRVCWPGVNLQLEDLLAAQAGLRQHPFNGKPQDSIRMRVHHTAIRDRLETARISRVAVIHLLVDLTSSHNY